VLDERFSADAFAALHEDREALEAHLALLKGEVIRLLRPALDPALAEVVETLRGLGHELAEFQRDPSEAEWLGYGDPDAGDGSLWLHHLSVPVASLAGVLEYDDDEAED
jgi:hypothetical protein